MLLTNDEEEPEPLCLPHGGGRGEVWKASGPRADKMQVCGRATGVCSHGPASKGKGKGKSKLRQLTYASVEMIPFGPWNRIDRVPPRSPPSSAESGCNNGKRIPPAGCRTPPTRFCCCSCCSLLACSSASSSKTSHLRFART